MPSSDSFDRVDRTFGSTNLAVRAGRVTESGKRLLEGSPTWQRRIAVPDPRRNEQLRSVAGARPADDVGS